MPSVFWKKEDQNADHTLDMDTQEGPQQEHTNHPCIATSPRRHTLTLTRVAHLVSSSCHGQQRLLPSAPLRNTAQDPD